MCIRDSTAGTYILEEVDPADGYSIIQSSETVYLADSGEQSVITCLLYTSRCV